jgi:hypothetical protein
MLIILYNRFGYWEVWENEFETPSQIMTLYNNLKRQYPNWKLKIVQEVKTLTEN